MFCLRSAEAFLRSKSVLLAAVFASVSSIAFSQESFMVHFTPSGGGAGAVQRGDFNNDGIPDIITGNNGGTDGYGVSVNLGIGDGRFRNPLNSGQGVGTTRSRFRLGGCYGSHRGFLFGAHRLISFCGDYRGHDMETTERYLGTKQDLVHAPNDGIKLRVTV